MGNSPGVVLFSMNVISLQYGLTATWYLYLYLVEILFVINPCLFATVYVKARAEFLVSLNFAASQSFFSKWSTILHLAWKPLYSYIQYHWGQQCVVKGRLIILIEGEAIFNLIAPRESIGSSHVPRIWSMCATSFQLRVKKDMIWLKLTLTEFP